MRSSAIHFRGRGLTRSLLACSLVLCGSLVAAQPVNLTGRVEVQIGGKKAKRSDASDVVVWLTPLSGPVQASARIDHRFSAHPRLVQKNKHFEPHVVVIPVGASVEFPNRDPFFHNVFSLFDGKRFDLGLYEAGTTRDVHFDKPGVSYIFCNIHAEMSAVVIALETPYYAISNARGEFNIPEMPLGRYFLRVWSEASLPDDLKDMTREITVSESALSLGVIRLNRTEMARSHKNKYGQDYPPANPAVGVYQQP
jgi:plastocyanin